MAMLLMARLEAPVLLKVTVWAALVVPIVWPEKVKLDGERATFAGVVPLSATDCGLLAALSVIVNVPVTLALLCGVKAMVIVQLAPPASGGPLQLLLYTTNGRVAATLLISKAAPPVLVTVRV